MLGLSAGRLTIAGRLFLSAALWSLAVLVVAGFALSAVYRRTAERALDERLGVYLKAIVADLASPGEDLKLSPGQLGEPQFELTRSGWYWQVTRLDGESQSLRASRSLFATRLPRLVVDESPGGEKRGYVVGPDEKSLRMLERIIDVGDEGRFLVQVAADSEEVDSQVFTFKWALGLTFALLGAALVGSTALQVRYGLQPLRRLREGVTAIRRGEAEKIGGDYPADIAPLADELNLLVAANREVVERARTQVGNLAHALKTPISVLMNEAAASPGAPLAEKVREQAGLMTHRVGHYLDRARAAARAASIGSATEVAPVLAGLVRTFEKIGGGRCDFSARAPDHLRFRGEAPDLQEMVGNLVDNAAKWAKGRVEIAADPVPAREGERRYLSLIVDDDGPGLAPSERATATRRGQRLEETKPGSGRGLPIATELADLYGGVLTLEDSPLGGLRARLTLPMI